MTVGELATIQAMVAGTLYLAARGSRSAHRVAELNHATIAVAIEVAMDNNFRFQGVDVLL